MFNSSILLAKLKRGKLNLENTFIHDGGELISPECNYGIVDLDSEEEILVSYSNLDTKYTWVLSNKKLYISSENKVIFLSDLIKVDFEKIKENPNSKQDNNSLELYTDSNKYVIEVERGTWHLFYSLFFYIINKNI